MNNLPSLKDQIYLCLTNPVFLSGFFGWVVAQFLKSIISLLIKESKSFKEALITFLWTTGGMPSSHSATTAAVCIAIGFRNGINSDLFLLSLLFFFVTIKDSFGVRRSSGLQAMKINEIIEELKNNQNLSVFEKLKVVKGHRPIETIFGTILGVIIGLLFSIFM